MKTLLSNVKNILLIASVFVISVLWISSCTQKARIKKYVESETTLLINQSIIVAENKDLKDSIQAESLKQKEIIAKSNALHKENLRLKKINDSLYVQLSLISEQVAQISTDSSYKFLQKEAYPSPGELKYPFNELQVKGIHTTYLERGALNILTLSLKKEITVCDESLVLKNQAISSYEKSLTLYKSQIINYEFLSDNKDKELNLKEKKLKRAERGKFIYKAVSIAEAILIFTKFVL